MMSKLFIPLILALGLIGGISTVLAAPNVLTIKGKFTINAGTPLPIAIAHDTTSTIGQGSGASVSNTTNFTIANNPNRVLMIGLVYQTSSAPDPTCKWNTSETMTLVYGPKLVNVTENMYIYELLAPSAVAAKVTCTKSEASKFITFWADDFYNVNQVLTDASTTATGSSTTATVNVTTKANNAWLFSVLRYFSSNIAAGTNTTKRTVGTANAGDIGDTNAAQTPPGAFQQTFTANSGAWGIGAVSLNPFVPPAQNFFQIN